MLPRGALLLLAAPLLACGSPSSSAPMVAAAATSAPAGAPSLTAPAPADGRCLASLTQKRVAGWTEHGKIAVALEDGQPTSLQALDADDTVVTTRPAPNNKSDARAAIKELTCLLGGTIATLEGTEPASQGAATATFVVLVPPVVDEKADLVALCREPEDRAPDGQKARLTFDQLEQRLTSRRWRAWLFDLADEHERTTGSDRMMLHWKRADELADAVRRAGLRGPCWFEAQLRSKTNGG